MYSLLLLGQLIFILKSFIKAALGFFLEIAWIFMIRYIARNDDKICHAKVIILISALFLYIYIVWPSDMLGFALMNVVILVFLHFAAKSSLAQFFSILQMQKKLG